MAGGSSAKLYLPPPSAMKVWLMPFSVLEMVTDALGMTAPVWSVMTPDKLAVVVSICALLRGAVLSKIASRVANPPQYHEERDLQLLVFFKCCLRQVHSLGSRTRDADRSAPEQNPFTIGYL